jgi:hypothetical protein
MMRICQRRWLRGLAATGAFLACWLGAQAPSAAAQSDSATPAITEQDVVGTWLSVRETLGALQTVLEFVPGGHVRVTLAARIKLRYEVLESDGSHLVIGVHEEGKQDVEKIQYTIQGDHLMMPTADGKNEPFMERLPGEPVGDSPIVGRWRWQPEGRPVAIMEYDPDGTVRFDSILKSFPGTYRLEGDTIYLEEVEGLRETAVLHLVGDAILGADKDGKLVLAYRRAPIPAPSPPAADPPGAAGSPPPPR